jgi:hypothetical protein
MFLATKLVVEEQTKTRKREEKRIINVRSYKRGGGGEE